MGERRLHAQSLTAERMLQAGTWEQLAKIVSRMSEERRNTLTVLVIGALPPPDGLISCCYLPRVQPLRTPQQQA